MILLILIALVVLFIVLYKPSNKKEEPLVTISDKEVTIEWLGHKITFEFSKDEDIILYHGAVCNEVYSASLQTSLKEDLPWKLWAQCGNDEVTILTDLKSQYKII